MNIADDSELIEQLKSLGSYFKGAGALESASIFKSAADRITELRMVRTMLYQRLNSLVDDNAELQRRVAKLKAIV